MDRIRQLRQQRRLSQVKLAVKADMDPATLNRLEKGKANPNLKTLERLAKALDVEVGDLFPKAQPPLWAAGQWGNPPGLNPPPPEQGGPQPGYMRHADLMRAEPYRVPAPEWLLPRLERVRSGDVAPEEFVRELQEYATSSS